MGRRTTYRNKMNWIEQLALAQAAITDKTEISTRDEVFAMEHIDKMEEGAVRLCDEVDLRTEHVFTPKLYTRIIFMPAGTFATSKIHKTTHPFVVMEGKCLVYNALKPNKPAEEIKAPYFGVTKPGARRAIMVLEDTVWITFHSTEKTTVEEVEEEIIKKHVNTRIHK